ncbi:beta 1-4 rhamnosyltransferase Cps2T [Liquorilactobacillus satsumensis]|uniref:beta 1-4 rhamnosyltransferase Cps2T n=6 Tax=Liquorilactobacillus satsumensis TaxID=259059 RepID=UPI0021C38EFA|nr:DUF1972 domain-containing protein [Liquorilactobacillus satsumensis]
MKDVFIVGSKGIPAKYGGFETFVDNLVTRQVNSKIKYHVSCLTFDKKVKSYEYNGAECQEIYVPNIGGAKAILYDLRSLRWSLSEIKKRNLNNGIIYILACRVGPFIHKYVSEFHKYGFQVFVNPDGHEWKRAKWSLPVRKYWKFSEKLMVKNADLLICDSKAIEKYIRNDYSIYNPKTTFIAYGADLSPSNLYNNDKKVMKWFDAYKLKQGNYFLMVGRFVPENNFEIIIKEFIKSSTKKKLVIVTNVEKNKYYKKLKENTFFYKDNRIKFVGTVYDKQLLKFIREHAFGYIHGHSVGGTNPSLLEALSSTKLNLLYNTNFNEEVGKNGALYWNKEKDNLMNLLNRCDCMSMNELKDIEVKAKKRIVKVYSWELIVEKYEKLYVIR